MLASTRPAGRRRATLVFALAASVGACAPAPSAPLEPSARSTAIVGALVEADRRELSGRAELVEGKYARMARTLYDFYRGSMPIFRADLADARMRVARTDFDLPGVLPFSLGDAHPENFGLLRAADGTLALEPNDLDAADRYPYQLDLRRLTTGLVLASRTAALDTDGEVEVTRACVASYLTTLRAIDEGSYAWTRVEDSPNPILADLFRRGRRDLAARAELSELTTLEGSTRRFRRGAPDSEDPENVLSDLPSWAVSEIPAALRAYRSGLDAPPPEPDLTVLDAVREHGSGVASWARIRVLVLVRGPSDDPADDVILELKEETQSGATGSLPPGAFADDETFRIRGATQAAWARPDSEPWWGASSWLGMPVQIRLESEAHKTFRTDRLEGALATPEALTGLASVVCEMLARVQSSRGLGADGRFASELVARLEERDAEMIAAEIEVAREHADVVTEDWQLFREALRTRGPTLGFVPETSVDGPDLERRALYGTPAEVRPWE